MPVGCVEFDVFTQISNKLLFVNSFVEQNILLAESVRQLKVFSVIETFQLFFFRCVSISGIDSVSHSLCLSQLAPNLTYLSNLTYLMNIKTPRISGPQEYQDPKNIRTPRISGPQEYQDPKNIRTPRISGPQE